MIYKSDIRYMLKRTKNPIKIFKGLRNAHRLHVAEERVREVWGYKNGK